MGGGFVSFVLAVGEKDHVMSRKLAGNQLHEPRLYEPGSTLPEASVRVPQIAIVRQKYRRDGGAEHGYVVRIITDVRRERRGRDDLCMLAQQCDDFSGLPAFLDQGIRHVAMGIGGWTANEDRRLAYLEACSLGFEGWCYHTQIPELGATIGNDCQPAALQVAHDLRCHILN